MAFLNERRELQKTFEDLKKEGTIPSGFQRMIDQHFAGEAPAENEVLLNRSHRLVGRALTQSPRSPLASVLRPAGRQRPGERGSLGRPQDPTAAIGRPRLDRRSTVGEEPLTYRTLPASATLAASRTCLT